MDLQHVFGAGPAVELVDVLGDDHHGAALFAQARLALSDGVVRGVGALAQRHLPPMVIELPDSGGVPREGLWSGQVLRGKRYNKAMGHEQEKYWVRKRTLRTY